MRNNIPAILFGALLLLAPTIRGHAQAASEQRNVWASVATKQSLKMKVLRPKEFDASRASPVVIYLENLAPARVGTDSDEAIVRDFLSDGYVVAVLDYAHNPDARVPFINRDILEMRDEVRARSLLPGIEIDPAHVFIVPSGSRLLRDVIFYHEPDRTLAMDIIYPSHSSRTVGAVIEFSCDNVNRMGNTSLSICSDTILDGEATEGLVVAMADHPVRAPYKGLDPMPDCAWKIKAAVRTLRAKCLKLGGSGKIVPVGFSRGSGMALMLETTRDMREFEGHGETTNVNSDVQGAVVMSGRFSYLDLLPKDHMIPRYNAAWGDRAEHLDVWRRAGALDYLAAATDPLFLTINCTEDADAQHQMAVLRKRLADLGNDEVFMMDREPRGHKVTLVPEILDGMNMYLKSRLN